MPELLNEVGTTTHLEILDNLNRTKLRPGDVLEVPAGCSLGAGYVARLRHAEHSPGEWLATVVGGGGNPFYLMIYLAARDRLQVVRRWLPMEDAPRDGTQIRVQAKGNDARGNLTLDVKWSTHYSIHGRGGCWCSVDGYGFYSDLHLVGWHPTWPQENEEINDDD